MRVVLAILLTPVLVLAQNSWEPVQALRPGQTVWVNYAKKKVTGSLVAVTPDSLVVRLADQKEVTAARTEITRISVPGNKRGRNALIGAAIGVGAALAPAIFWKTYKNNETGGGEQDAAAIIAVGAGIGAGLGALNRGRETVYKSN